MAPPLLDATTPEFLDLLALCPIVPGATVSKPLVNLPECKVVVFAMDVGQEMIEHRAPFIASVHILDGQLRFGIADAEKIMGPSQWLLMPTNTPHRLTALQPTRFLLTLFKRESA